MQVTAGWPLLFMVISRDGQDCFVLPAPFSHPKLEVSETGSAQPCPPKLNVDSLILFCLSSV